jgi:hypothetical protein
MVWESIWHPEKRRFYFWDRTTGKTTWVRPPDYKDEPLKPPPPKDPDPDSQQRKPHPAEALPPGWSAAWDYSGKSNRYYYYDTNHPHDTRTWLMPPRSEEEDEEEELNRQTKLKDSMDKLGSVSHAFGSIQAGIGAQDQSVSYGGLKNHWWDADSFAVRLQEARIDRDNPHVLQDVLKEVVEHNKGLLAVPRTTVVPWDPQWENLRGLSHLKHGQFPTLTFSHLGLADACYALLKNHSGEVVCLVNPADGSKPGGKYLEGGEGPEEELCRRLPSFHDSLQRARRQSAASSASGKRLSTTSTTASAPSGDAYPFGLAVPRTMSASSSQAASDAEARSKEVLLTPGMILVRGPEDIGFPMLPARRQVVFSVVSVPFPSSDNVADKARLQDIKDSITAMFLAPIAREPRPSTLVIGPWGFDTSEEHAKEIAQLLVGAVTEKARDLGRFYKEIHFCIPARQDSEHKEIDVMKFILKALKARGIQADYAKSKSVSEMNL